MASAGTGLNQAYCRAHVEHFRRHGSYSKSSYTAALLAPYRRDAFRRLQTHSKEQPVRTAVERVGTLYRRAGSPVEAFRRAGLSPEERAAATWAALKVRQVDPLQVLAVWLAVCACHEIDCQPERSIEYRHVQAAKLLHRMAGGTHKRWGGQDGVRETRLDVYPASRGNVLRHLGRQVASAAESLMPHFIESAG